MNALVFVAKIVFCLLYSLIQYISTTVSPPSSLLKPPTPYTPHPFPIKKGQASKGYQPNLAYQAIIRLCTYPDIKAG